MADERIGVFCGARPGTRPEYLELAKEFGGSLARRGFGLVHTCAGVGVMSALVDGVLTAGGTVTGLAVCARRERAPYGQAGEAVFVVRSIHQRKDLMYRLSSRFAVLPGGIDTLDELLGVATWNQLGLINKPVVIVNYAGFFDPVLRMLDHLATEGFLSDDERNMIRIAGGVAEAFDQLGPAR